MARKAEKMRIRAPDATAFDRTLQRLKQRGCCMLLVGSVAESVFSRASRQMLGDPSLRRYRLFVLTDADRSVVTRRLSGVDETDRARRTQILTTDATTRSTSIRSNADANSIPTTVVDDDSESLIDSIDTTIQDFERRSGGLEPGSLRLCFDSLRPIVDSQDGERSLRFCNRLSASVRGSRGLGHVVLPLPRDSEPVERLTRCFDAVVELRSSKDRGPQERWHFTRENLTTNWIAL